MLLHVPFVRKTENRAYIVNKATVAEMRDQRIADCGYEHTQTHTYTPTLEDYTQWPGNKCKVAEFAYPAMMTYDSFTKHQMLLRNNPHSVAALTGLSLHEIHRKMEI